MSKCRSLENQMLHALASAKSQESKRSYRSETGSTGAKIFSMSYETDLRDTIGNICRYLKDDDEKNPVHKGHQERRSAELPAGEIVDLQL